MSRLVGLMLLGALLVGLSGCGQPAEPSAHVRENSSFAGEKGVCSPLPKGLLEGVPYAVALNGLHKDDQGASRRSMQLHLSEPAEEVRALIEDRLSGAGFEVEELIPAEPGSVTESGPVTEGAWLTHPDYGTLGYRVSHIPGTGPETPVRTLLEVDTPGRRDLRADNPQCLSPGPVEWSTLPAGAS